DDGARPGAGVAGTRLGGGPAGGACAGWVRTGTLGAPARETTSPEGGPGAHAVCPPSPAGVPAGGEAGGPPDRRAGEVAPTGGALAGVAARPGRSGNRSRARASA